MSYCPKSSTAVTPQFYIKKPLKIEAIQFIYGGDKSTVQAIQDWAGDAILSVTMERRPDAVAQMMIKTLEGQHIASNGDWIIKGIKGEFYPRKPDIFEKTYAAVVT